MFVLLPVLAIAQDTFEQNRTQYIGGNTSPKVNSSVRNKFNADSGSFSKGRPVLVDLDTMRSSRSIASQYYADSLFNAAQDTANDLRNKLADKIGYPDTNSNVLTPAQANTLIASSVPIYTNCRAADSTTVPDSGIYCYILNQAAVSYDSFLQALATPVSVTASDLQTGEVKLTKGATYWQKSVISGPPVAYYVAKDTLLRYDTIRGQNLFDGGVVYNSYWNTTTGAISPAAGWARTARKIKALPLTTYAVSGIGVNRYAVYYNAAGTRIGSDLNGTAVSGGYTFTAPSGTDSIGFNLTTTGQTGFETTLNVNKSNSPLPYEAPGAVSYNTSVKDKYLSYNYYSKSETDTKIATLGSVIIDTPYIYVRTPFDAVTDLVQRLTLNTTATTIASTAKPVNFWGTYLIAKSTPNTAYYIAIGCAQGTLIHNNGDDAAPINDNGTYIAANHGPTMNVNILASGHGKTTDDEGSIYTDATGKNYKIMKYVDGNNLWILNEDLGLAGDIWNFDVTPVSPLTWTSGGSNHGNITFTTVTQTQLLPILQNHVVKLLVDGRDVGFNDGGYYYNDFSIQETYSIPHLPAVYNYVTSHATTDYNNSSIAKSVDYSIRYRFDQSGGCTSEASLRNYKEISLNYAGFTQSINLFLNATTDSIYHLIPNTLPFVGASKTWDFSAGENITTWNENFDIDKAHWSDTNKAPYRYAQVLKKSGTKTVCFEQGYSAIKGITQLSTRKNYTNNAGFLFTSKKMYPAALNSVLNVAGKIPAGQYWQVIAYRSYQNPANAPNAYSYSLHKEGDAYLLALDYQTAVTNDKVTLPPYLSGYTVTPVDTTGSITTTNSFVDNSTIYVTSTGSKQFIVLKLTK